MQVKQFKVTLLGNVILNERAASEGKHRSLDYLPGATFLGAVANRLYNELLSSSTPEDAYTVFHSGKVRFGNALPLTDDGYLSYPTPFCWYTPKGRTNLLNYQDENNRRRKIQPEPWYKNHRFVSSKKDNEEFPSFSQQFRMNTAIDFDKGIAKDEQFFGYYSLPKGRQFVFNLEANDIDEALFNKVIHALTCQLKLGCSRSAEYGAVRVELLPEPKDERKIESLSDKGVTFWLLADAAFQDDFGQPALYPTAKSIGLPTHFELDQNKTFVRSHRYAPFNSYRGFNDHHGSRELERVVLNMGSVLHFNCQDGENVDTKILQDIQACGIGLYRQMGLGRIWINPKILASSRYEPLSHPTLNQSRTRVIKRISEPTDSVVYSYLTNRMRQDNETQQIENILYRDQQNRKDWISELELLYQSAHLLHQGGQGEWIGPSPTQWGRVMEIANTTSVEQLEKKLFEDTDAVCKEKDSQWIQQIIYEPDRNIDDFRKWFLHKIQTTEKPDLLTKIVSRFAHLARDVAINNARRK